MEAVADAGITFEAWSPTRELAMPRMFSDGSVISSVSVFGAPSVEPEPELAASAADRYPAPRRSRAVQIGQRLDVVVEAARPEPGPLSSFIDVSSRASVSAGLGAQLP